MRILTLAAALLCASACMHAQAQDSAEATITALERQSWVAWQNHDGAFYARFLSDDHVEVHRTGMAAKRDIVAFVGSGACTVASYSLGDFHFTQFSADSAVLTYRAEQDTTCGQSRAPSPTWVTSEYVLRDGRWQNALYVQTPTVDAH